MLGESELVEVDVRLLDCGSVMLPEEPAWVKLCLILDRSETNLQSVNQLLKSCALS